LKISSNFAKIHVPHSVAENQEEAEVGFWRETTRVKVAGIGYRAEFDVSLVGPSDGARLVLTPGWRSGLETVQHKTEAFAKAGFQVLTLAQPDYITSRRSFRFHSTDGFERYAECIRGAMDDAGWYEANLYGSSTGGSASISFAATHSFRAKAVIAVNPAGMIRQSVFKLALSYARVKGQPVVKEAMLPGRLGRFRREILNPKWFVWELAQFLGPVGIAASETTTDCLRRVECPVFLYLGGDDNVFPPKRIIQGLRSRGLYPQGLVAIHIERDFIHPDPQTEEKAERMVARIVEWLMVKQATKE
jgi:pimeloyl-ACP methyl ester carboxylesterase